MKISQPFSLRIKIILGIIMLGLVSVIFYQSYAIFKESRKLRFIWGVVEDFEQTPDIGIKVFINGERSTDGKFPNKQNHKFERLECTNSGNAEFDEDRWEMAIKNITDPTECGIYFVYYKEYEYIGNVQEFVVPTAGYYNLEAWGASGGDFSIYTGGAGAYTSGIIYLEKNEKIYIYVGGKNNSHIGGWNGGGSASYELFGAGGGGATDFRLVKASTTNPAVWDENNSLRSRIMVAAGGGGAGDRGEGYGGSNGAIGGMMGGHDTATQNMTNGYGSYYITGAWQTHGGIVSFNPGTYPGLSQEILNQFAGKFGKANYEDDVISYLYSLSPGTPQTGGGGGWYGGAAIGHAGGSGGSSFVAGLAGVNAIDANGNHLYNTKRTDGIYNTHYFIDGRAVIGSMGLGNGKAKITYEGATISKQNTKLNNVRYIKSCIKGSNLETVNRWVEIQALKDGLNLAKGKPVVGSVNQDNLYPYSNITDGEIHTSNYGESSILDTLSCVTVDLGQIYDLDEVVLWLAWGKGETFYQNTFSVGANNPGNNTTTPLDTVLHTYSGTNGYVEDSAKVMGKRYTAWD